MFRDAGDPSEALTLKNSEETPVDEIAALIHTIGTPLNSRSVSFERLGEHGDTGDGQNHSVSTQSPLYDLLHYVLLFPVIPRRHDRAAVDFQAWSYGNDEKLALFNPTRRLLTEPSFATSVWIYITSHC